jgi:hypothetical protein
MKIIDGMVWCNEIEKWVTPKEYIKEYSQDIPGFEGTLDDLENLSIYKNIEPDFDWENEVANAR